MDWFASLGLLIGVGGIIISIKSHFDTKALRNHLLSEKDLIHDKILDIKQVWQGYYNSLQNDKKMQDNDNLNTLNLKIRIEEIEVHLQNLQRFADRLQNLK